MSEATKAIKSVGKMESAEDSTTSAAKRPAEATESTPIGPKKPSEDGDSSECSYSSLDFDTNESDDMGMVSDLTWVKPNLPDEKRLGCIFCTKLDYQLPKDCENYARTPLPSPEDIANNRDYYCNLCRNYVDHARYECPTQEAILGYRRAKDGGYEDFRCCLCGKDVYPSLGDCPLAHMLLQ